MARAKKAFTLTEILIVLIIIGILAALGLPQYTSSRERALGKEARANLKIIAAAEKIYRLEQGFYYPYNTTQGNASQINANLQISVNERNWDYGVLATAPDAGDSFNSTALRSACAYSLTNNDTDGEPNPAGTCP